jgi:hypothetical protein
MSGPCSERGPFFIIAGKMLCNSKKDAINMKNR